MAGLDDARSHRSSHRTRRPRGSPTLSEDAWTEICGPAVPDPPSWHQQPDIESDELELSSTVSSRQCPTEPRAPARRPPVMRTPTSAVPVLTRAATVPVRRPTYMVEEEGNSRSDSRPSGSRWDRSPPSAPLCRSTPNSATSSQTSLSDAGGETDDTASTQDARERRPARKASGSRHASHRRRSHRRTRTREPEIIYEEEDSGREASYAPPSPDRPRSPSQHAADRHGRSRRPQQQLRRRASSLGASRSRSRPNRLSTRHYESEGGYRDIAPPSLRKSHTTGASRAPSLHSVASSARRSSFLGSFFGSSMQGHASERPAKLAECVVCRDATVPSHKTAKLKCGHRMCHSCLRQSFRLSIHDPQHMPPRCCTSDHIPLKHVEKLFDSEFKRAWNMKYAESSMRNRIYCASRRCGEWIRPENIRRDYDGRRYAECGRCRTRICCRCHGKWHHSRECPGDEGRRRFLGQAEQEGWQRCHRCKAMVELEEGCNHMTCRCGAEFCIICGAKWKTCDCPWFSHDEAEDDTLENIPNPMDIRSEPGHLRAGMFSPSALPFTAFPPGGGTDFTAAVRPRPQSYEEELMLHRLKEQRDDELACRMQAFGDPNEGYAYGLYGSRHQSEIGSAAGPGHGAGYYYMEDDRRQPQRVMAAPSAPRSAFDMPGPGPEYVSGASRPRGARASSMERRLADRFNSDLRHSPMRMTAPAPAPPPPPPPPPLGPLPPHSPMIGGAASYPPSLMMPQGGVPRAPMPPPAVPNLSMHTMEEQLYNSPRRVRPSERAVPGRMRHDYESETAVHAPPRRRRQQQQQQQQEDYRQHRQQQHYQQQYEPEEEVRTSVLAGLDGSGRGGMGRVHEWLAYVEPGVSGGESSAISSM